MWGNAALRALSGYMIFFLVFLLRADHFPGVSQNVALGGMVGAAAAGGLVAMGIGSMLKSRAPQVMHVQHACPGHGHHRGSARGSSGCRRAHRRVHRRGRAPRWPSSPSTRSCSEEIGEDIRSSAFAVSETLHQVSWVAGGLAGLAVSYTNSGPAGLAVAAAGVGVSLFLLLAQRRRRIRARGQVAPRPRPTPWPR